MLKVLMILDREFPPDKRVENEIETLIKAGYVVHIACYTRNNMPVLEATGNLTIHRKPISPFVYKSSVACLTLPFYFNYWKKFISEILSCQTFDIIHIHDLPLARLGAQFKKSGNMRLVVDLHENWPAFVKISRHTNTLIGKLLSPVFLWRIYEKKVLQHADAVIVVIEEAKDRLIGLTVPADKIHIVSNTINFTELRNLSSHDPLLKNTILYYVGGINHHRGLQTVILALHKTKNTKIEFWMVGEGSYKDNLSELIQKLSLSNRVIFKGFQPFHKVMEMLSKADYAIIPHLKTEHTDSTIPNKLFQYMYAQKPVIASNCQPVQRILEETGAGIVYPSGEADRLSEIFDQLGTLDYYKMAANGKKAITEKYNWNFDSRILLNLYQNIK
jgi:glycosyltransferase involved in cell wall biosynthesis